jgi:8-oxo-dGTP pyrophosphatase MutT (NUDIX family)
MSEIKAAGCLFIQGDYVLTGYNPKLNIWSGIGGKIEKGELPYQTAFRETIEELYGLIPSKEIIDNCVKIFSTYKMIIKNNYGFIPFSFDKISTISHIIKEYIDSTPYYDYIPMSFNELITIRKTTENMEITELKVINYKQHNPDISLDLLLDCEESQKTNIN